MKKQFYIAIIFPLLLPALGFGQFPPAAGQEGSTAIHKDSSIFIGWANGCTVERGYLNIAQPETGFVEYGSEDDALGIADNSVVSLGDGGVATLTFETPLADGEGFDFAVFENGFSDTFLELAFVEVSSDGENFFRFDAVSLTQTEVQTGSFGELNTEKINNLAGKYRVEYGTPFDLQELANTPGLNINNITQVRIIDVIGSVSDDYATFDSQGNKINDPWPTPFPSGGFDLDAVGVIHDKENLYITSTNKQYIRIFPNPIPANRETVQVYFYGDIIPNRYSIIGFDGREICRGYFDTNQNGRKVININKLNPGFYVLMLETENGILLNKIIRR